MKLKHRSRLVVLASAVLVAVLQAQVVGTSIFGAVQDESGAGIAQAQVVIRSVETGASRTLTTDDAGRYAAPSIAVGAYQITASKEGFAAQVKTGIDLVVGQSATVNFRLVVGELRQTVTVEESPAPVNLSTQQTSGLVSERQVKELPLNGRSYDSLMTLNPAVVNYTSERSGGVGTSNSSVGNMFTVSGRRPQENLFLLNGIEYTGASEINNTPGGASGQLLGVEAVREFNVVTDTYGAEYGKRPGGQVSIVTASGSNQFHGSVYEFLRNSAFDARNFFDQGSIPQFQRNQFGVAGGGPIRKDKLFLFGNYEGYQTEARVERRDVGPRRGGASGLFARIRAERRPLWDSPRAWPLYSRCGLRRTARTLVAALPRRSAILCKGSGRTSARCASTTISRRTTLYSRSTPIDDSYAGTPTVNPLSRVVEGLREQVGSVQEQHLFSSTILNTARIGFSRGGYFFTGIDEANLPGMGGQTRR